MKLNLMLVGIKSYTGKDGDPMKKLIFLSENNQAYVGYCEASRITPEIEALVTDTNTFQPARARAWEVDQDVYAGKLSYRVVVS